MKKAKGILKFLIFLAVVIIVCLFLQITPIADAVAKATGSTGDKIKAAAKTVATIALGAVMISWGIAALAVPFLGVSMILIGLVMLAYAVYPMFTKSSAAQAASYDSAGPMRIFG